MRPVVPKNPIVHLSINTWEKDSHGLFDFEADRLVKEQFRIQGPCKIFRDWFTSKTVIIPTEKIRKGLLPEQNYSFLASIVANHNGNYQQFTLLTPQCPSQQIYRKQNSEQSLVINTNSYHIVNNHRDLVKDKGFPLRPGNIFKVGRVEFKVVQIGGLPKQKKENLSNFFLGDFNGIFEVNQIKQGSCKICLCEENTDDDFLVSPCACKGHCGVIHINCLKQWIDSKVKKEVNGVVRTYNFNKFQCQICKVAFPRMIVRDNFKLEMITIERPTSGPYIILQGINERKQSKQEKCMHLISLTEAQTIKMGRGHQCEIRLQDISVSRTHSQIKYSAGEFYLNDQDSKFGTLIRVQKQSQLFGKLKLQVGRSVYQFIAE